jgi:hypothetical protein
MIGKVVVGEVDEKTEVTTKNGQLTNTHGFIAVLRANRRNTQRRSRC